MPASLHQEREPRKDQIKYPTIVVYPFGTIDERPTFQRHSDLIVLDSFVAKHSSHGHGKFEDDGITCFPDALQEGIALVERDFERRIIDLDRSSVRISLEIAI